jgi:hypothetical protein
MGRSWLSSTRPVACNAAATRLVPSVVTNSGPFRGSSRALCRVIFPDRHERNSLRSRWLTVPARIHRHAGQPPLMPLSCETNGTCLVRGAGQAPGIDSGTPDRPELSVRSFGVPTPPTGQVQIQPAIHTFCRVHDGTMGNAWRPQLDKSRISRRRVTIYLSTNKSDLQHVDLRT